MTNVVCSNLQIANHVIFACPLDAIDQFAWDSQHKQAIGRARRYGQRKTVSVYRMLAMNTLDVDLQEYWSGQKLVRLPTGGYSMKSRSLLNKDEAEQDWGSGLLTNDDSGETH